MNTLEIISQSQNCLEITDSNQCALEITPPAPIAIEVAFAVVLEGGSGDGITEDRVREIADEEIEVQAVNAGPLIDYGSLVKILTNT